MAPKRRRPSVDSSPISSVPSSPSLPPSLPSFSLVSRGFSSSMISQQRPAAEGQRLKRPKALNKFDNSDIQNKITRNKQKFLFQLPGRFHLLPGGKCLDSGEGGLGTGRLGELSALDTASPCLFLEFPHGRIKMRGALVYPHNAFVAIEFPLSGRSSSGLLCKGSFDNLIVLSQYYWVGTAEENPEENPLPWPKHFQKDQKSSGNSLVQLDNRGKEEKSAGKENTSKSEKLSNQQEEEEELSSSSSSSSAVSSQSSRGGRARPRRESRKKIIYKEKEEEEEDDDEEEESVASSLSESE